VGATTALWNAVMRCSSPSRTGTTAAVASLSPASPAAAAHTTAERRQSGRGAAPCLTARAARSRRSRSERRNSAAGTGRELPVVAKAGVPRLKAIDPLVAVAVG
jgi:hypothetical protein